MYNMNRGEGVLCVNFYSRYVFGKHMMVNMLVNMSVMMLTVRGLPHGI